MLYLLIYLAAAIIAPILIAGLSVVVANWVGRGLPFFGAFWPVLIAGLSVPFFGTITWASFVFWIINQIVDAHRLPGSGGGDGFAMLVIMALSGAMLCYCIIIGLIAALIAYLRHQKWDAARTYDDA